MSNPIVNVSTTVQSSRFPAGSANTQDGLDWLTCVTDPYHDNNLRISGVPSLVANLSYMRQIKSRMTIARAASHTGVWDCHIFFSDVADDVASVRATRSRSAGIVAHGRVFTRGLITVVRTPANESITHEEAKWSTLPVDFEWSEATRIAGAAFEVHNTTAEMYKCGSATCWRSPSVQEHETAHTAGLGGVDSLLGTSVTSGLPTTLELANLLPTSRTWNAAEGILLVAQPDFSNLTFRKQKAGVAYLELDPLPGQDGSEGVCTVLGPDEQTDKVPTYRPSGLTPCGVIFAGLNADTTLSLDCRVFVECAPGMLVEELSLSTPSAQYDPKAIATAASIFHVIPPGVEVKHNSFGSWFRNVLGVASKVLPTVAALIPHAGARLAASTAGSIAGAVSNVLPKKTPPGGLNAASGRMTHPAPVKKK